MSDVSDAPDLLFVTDHARFVDVVTNDDAEARLAAFANSDDLALCEIARYGLYNRAEMIAPLAAFYRDCVMPMPEERRSRIFRHIKGLVENVSHVSTNALLPFLAEDTARAIVSTSVIDYVSLTPLSDGDPMSHVKDVIDMIERGRPRNEGAAFGALLHIGDERVCKLLRPLRDSLDHDAINEAVKCATGFMHAAVVDFYLDWLDGLSGDDGVFGLVASGLALLKKTSVTDQVHTGQRPFPVRGVAPEQWNEMARPIALAAYRKRIAPRMYALERSEPPPRVMPHVLAEWGLPPLTERGETARLDDRSKAAAG
jgi:hypothetical protein